jgi:hypothetical protein
MTNASGPCLKLDDVCSIIFCTPSAGNVLTNRTQLTLPRDKPHSIISPFTCHITLAVAKIIIKR